jgi:hypothetical protein
VIRGITPEAKVVLEVVELASGSLLIVGRSNIAFLRTPGRAEAGSIEIHGITPLRD